MRYDGQVREIQIGEPFTTHNLIIRILMSYNLLYTPNGYNTKIAPDMLASLTQ